MNTLDILLVDDSPLDLRVTREALAASGFPGNTRIASGGAEALSILQEPHYLPDLIMMDLSMPEMSGLELLGHLKSDPRWRRIPVVILSGSEDEEDVLRSYDGHASSYVAKHADLERFFERIRSLRHYWGTVARLPGALPA